MRALRALGRWVIVVLGRPWVFWPGLAVAVVLQSGPDLHGSPWLWVVAVLVAGPGLALVIHGFAVRSAARSATDSASVRPVGPMRRRLLSHFRGTAASRP